MKRSKLADNFWAVPVCVALLMAILDIWINWP
jgi:hypothetical protein